MGRLVGRLHETNDQRAVTLSLSGRTTEDNGQTFPAGTQGAVVEREGTFERNVEFVRNGSAVEALRHR